MNRDHHRQTDRDNASGNRSGIKRRDLLLSGSSVFAASALIAEALVTATSKPANAQATAPTSTALSSDLIGEIATSSYIYAYPLLIMEMTRRVSTNVADSRQFIKAPMNQFAHVPAFPDATSRTSCGRTPTRSIRCCGSTWRRNPC
jgi:hypothetical protein